MEKNYPNAILSKYSVLLLFFLASSFTNFSFGQTIKTYTYTGAAQTWTCPSGVFSVTVEAWGAGGAGGNGGSSNKNAGGGGGGGAYSKISAIAVNPGTIYTINVGAGGTAGATVGADGGDGGSSNATFGATTITALGGTGGKGYTGSKTGAGAVGLTFNGGNGAAGNSASGIAGGGGEGAGTTSIGGNASGCTGGSGTDGGNGASYSDCVGGNSGGGTAATTATGFGGGGSGSVKNLLAGNGASGQIKITFNCPINTIANAGPDQPLAACTTTATLAGNTPTYGTGTWTLISGTATITSPNSPTSGVTGLVLGTSATLRWTISNNDCGSTQDDVIITTSYGPGCWNYCTAGGATNTVGELSNVTFNTINRNSTFDGYINTGLTTTVSKTLSYNLSITKNINSTYTTFTEAWIDWNNDGDFADASEIVLSSLSSTTSGSETRTVAVTVPAGATTGVTRMRVMMKYNTAPVATGCDTSTTYMDVEDYYINIIPAVACIAPTAQPTVLNLTPTGTTVAGTFTAASPVADNYLVLISTSATAPSPGPVNGTTYIIGGTINGATVVDTDSNTAFTATGLTPLTTYYVYVYSFNSACTGGPLYLTTSPLTGNTTTLVANYCTPTTTNGGSSLYITKVDIIGTLSDPGVNNSTYNTVAPIGFQDFTSLPSKGTQAQGEGVNIVTTCNGTSAGRGTWKAWVDWNKDGDFVDAGEEVYNIQGWVGQTQTFGFVIPAAQTPGDYRIRIRVNNGLTNYGPPTGTAENYGFDFNPCENFGSPNASTDYYGEAEDYLFTVIANCASKITSVTNGITCGTGTATLSATGTGATQYRWYSSEFGGVLVATTATGSWTTPSVAVTTSYWVTSFNGTCESVARTEVKAIVKPTTTLTVSNATPTVCGEGSIIDLAATGGNEEYHLINEDFEGGTLGVFSNINNDTSTDAGKSARAWTNKTSTYVPNSTNGNTWFPALSSGFGTNKFALATSDSNPIPNSSVDNTLTSVAVDGTGVSNLKLKLNLYYSRYWADGTHVSPTATTDPNPEYITIEATYNNWTGVTVLATITSDTGIGSRFVTLPVYNLPATFNNQASIKIRVRHHSYAASGTGYLGDGVAVDEIELYGDKPLTNPSFALSGVPTPAAFTTALCTPGSEYMGGPVPKIWVKPTLPQLELSTYSFTATATLSNGCPVSATINVTNESKVWKGTTSNDWNVAGNWLPSGVPNATTCVIIPTGTTSKIINTPDALAKNLTVKAPTGNLELQAAKNLTVTDFINVEAGATFNVRNSANLVQINNAAVNTGSINMDRTATGLHSKDYIYWSTPVENFGVANVSPLTSTSRIYHWTPDYFNGAGYGYGNWFNVNEIMAPGKGYIIRVPNSSATLSATFTGKPQNGTITKTIKRGPYVGATYTGTNSLITTLDDNWNLVGNPYPSSIDAVEFLTANSAVIAGEVNLWTHTTPISLTASPYYQTFVYNYKSNDYVTYNSAGNNVGPTGGFNGKIGAGQAFFVKMLDGAAGSGTITFNNGMRNDATNTPYNNGQFYKASGNQGTATEPEKHRIWLDLIDSNLNTSRVMFGYIDGATNEKDHMYDATTNYTESLKAFTTINNNEDIFVIQGKALPFDVTDKISYGIQVPANGTYSIAISDVDGLFKTEGQKIYIEDLLTNITQDLTVSPYTFTSEQGTFKNRFLIKYDNQTLSNNDVEYANSVIVFGKEQLTVKSELFNIKNIAVYDLLGKTLLNVKDVNTKEYSLASLKNTNSALLVKTTLENGAIVTKKVIY